MGAAPCGNWGRYSITSNFYGTNEKLSAKIIEDAVEMSEKWDFTGLHVESIERKGSKFTTGKKVGSCKNVMAM